jgi:peptidoglycan/LPS O-acetylase OafA/YrhL
MIKKSSRIEYLDSLRGLGAIIVGLAHYETFYPFILNGEKIFKGHVAVSLFFVLSGYVLSLSLRKEDAFQNFTLGAFIIKRFFRLWVPFSMALIFSLFCHESGKTTSLASPPFSQEYVERWTKKIDTSQVKNELLDFYSPNLLAPSWSLKPELVNSLILPFGILILRHSILWFIFSVLLGVYFNILPFAGLHFSLGVLLAFYDKHVINFVRYTRIAVPGMCLICLFYFINLQNILIFDTWAIWAVCSFALLAFVLASPKLQYILDTRFLRFLGTVSFGIYLLHWPIMFISLPILSNFTVKNPIFFEARWFLFGLIYIFITFLASTVFYIFVEKPAIKLGKQIAELYNNKISNFNKIKNVNA